MSGFREYSRNRAQRKEKSMSRGLWLVPLAAMYGMQIAAAQSADAAAALLPRLLDEVRALRVELAESRLDRQAEKIRLLQHEMDSARNLRTKLEAQARSQEEELSRFRNQ